jgi:hypothetical protein
MWRGEPDNVKAHYAKLAEEEKTNHRIVYPGYKCSPRKSSQIKKRKTCKENTDAKHAEPESASLPPVEVQSHAIATQSKLAENGGSDAIEYPMDWVDAALANSTAYFPETNAFEGPADDFPSLANTTAEYQEEESEIFASDGFNPSHGWN